MIHFVILLQFNGSYGNAMTGKIIFLTFYICATPFIIVLFISQLLVFLMYSKELHDALRIN